MSSDIQVDFLDFQLLPINQLCMRQHTSAEWLDFPRIGNGESYHYARRQWSLVDNDLLKYKFLSNWDRAMNFAEEKYHWLSSNDSGYISWKHESDKVIAFERAGVVFVFNFNNFQSFSDYKVGMLCSSSKERIQLVFHHSHTTHLYFSPNTGVEVKGKYQIVLNSDAAEFGGFDRIDMKSIPLTFPEPYAGRKNHICVYIPSRTCIALAKID